LISPAHKCIFIHVPKAAGTSIEQVFLTDLGLPLEDRGQLLLGPNPDPRRGPRRLSHLTARELRSFGYISPGLFDSYFKFAFVRDPWDRAVSTYKYLRIGGEFKRFVCDILPNSLMNSDYYGYFVRPQYDYLHDDQGNRLVDFVGRFERLEDDFNVIRKRLRLGAALPHKNQHLSSRIPLASRVRQAAFGALALSPAHVIAAFRAKEVHERPEDYFDKESAALIGEIYKADVDAFGYEFEA
jgi:hypothetical protein